MNEDPSSNTRTRPLDILGISEPEERVYRWLLMNPPSVAAEAGRALGLSVGRTQRLLDRIEAKGLATHSPEWPRRYIPISPRSEERRVGKECRSRWWRCRAQYKSTEGIQRTDV